MVTTFLESYAAGFENTGNVFKPNKPSREVTVFTKEKINFVNQFNEQNSNNQVPPVVRNLNVSIS